MSESMMLAVVAVTLVGAAIVGDLLDGAVTRRGHSSDQDDQDA